MERLIENKELKRIIESLATWESQHERLWRKVNGKMAKMLKMSRNYTLRCDKARSRQRNGKEQTKLLKTSRAILTKAGRTMQKWKSKENIKILTGFRWNETRSESWAITRQTHCRINLICRSTSYAVMFKFNKRIETRYFNMPTDICNIDIALDDKKKYLCTRKLTCQ